MRHHFGVTILSIVLLSTPSVLHAQARSQVQGFGGFTFGDTAAASTFGGNIGFELTDNILIVGEAGRLSDVKPSLLIRFSISRPSTCESPPGVRRGWRQVQRVRLRHPAVRGGHCRLCATAHRLQRHSGDVIDGALGFLDRTEPLLGVGGGVIVQGGPLVLDLGYRYKKILADNSFQSLLNSGDDFDVSQVRVGVGVRFSPRRAGGRRQVTIVMDAQSTGAPTPSPRSWPSSSLPAAGRARPLSRRARMKPSGWPRAFAIGSSSPGHGWKARILRGGHGDQAIVLAGRRNATRVYVVSPAPKGGEPDSRLVSVNGKPPSEDEREEDEERRERDREDVESRSTSASQRRRAAVEDLRRGLVVKIEGRETVDGHQATVLSFEPRPARTFKAGSGASSA